MRSYGTQKHIRFVVRNAPAASTRSGSRRVTSVAADSTLAPNANKSSRNGRSTQSIAAKHYTDANATSAVTVTKATISPVVWELISLPNIQQMRNQHSHAPSLAAIAAIHMSVICDSISWPVTRAGALSAWPLIASAVLAVPRIWANICCAITQPKSVSQLKRSKRQTQTKKELRQRRASVAMMRANPPDLSSPNWLAWCSTRKSISRYACASHWR